eukprot:PhF_6_TR12612/c0_g1_i2/m.19918
MQILQLLWSLGYLVLVTLSTNCTEPTDIEELRKSLYVNGRHPEGPLCYPTPTTAWKVIRCTSSCQLFLDFDYPEVVLTGSLTEKVLNKFAWKWVQFTSGSVDVEFGRWLEDVDYFWIDAGYQGKMTGAFPTSMPQLTEISIDHEQFSMVLPSHLPNLMNFYIGKKKLRCALHGRLPTYWPKISEVIIQVCPITVYFSDFQNATKLKSLSLLEVDLTDTMPAMILELPSLQILRLENVNVNGTLPEFTRDTLVYELELARVPLYGMIPGSWLSLIKTLTLTDSYVTHFYEGPLLNKSRLSSFHCTNCKLKMLTRFSRFYDLRSIDVQSNVFPASDSTNWCAYHPEFVLRNLSKGTRPCHFPFRMDDQNFTACTEVTAPGTPFCSTSDTYAVDDYGYCVRCNNSVIFDPDSGDSSISIRNNNNLYSILFSNRDWSNNFKVAMYQTIDISENGLSDIPFFDFAQFYPNFQATKFYANSNNLWRDPLQLLMNSVYNSELTEIDYRNNTRARSMNGVYPNHGLAGMTGNCTYDCLNEEHPACLPATLKFSSDYVYQGRGPNMWCRAIVNRQTGEELTFLRDTNFFEYEECECSEGFYGVGNDCVRCLPHMFCPAGPVKKPWIHPDLGYYLDDKILTRCRHHSTETSACLRPKLITPKCGSGVTPKWTQQCAHGHTGRLCSRCLVGFGKVGDTCVSCTEGSGSVMFILSYFFGLAITLGYIYVSVFRSQGGIGVVSDNVLEVSATTSLGVGYTQLLGIIASSVQFSNDALSNMLLGPSMPTSGKPVNMECVLQTLGVTQVTAAAIFAAQLMFIFIPFCFCGLYVAMRMGYIIPTTIQRKKIFAVACNMFYPQLINVALQLMTCSRGYLVYFPDEKCNDPAIRTAGGFAYAILTVLFVSVISFTLTIRKYVKRTGTTPDHLRFLIAPFKPERWYWFIVMQVRNTIYVVLLTANEDDISKAAGFILACCMYSLFAVRMAPYKSPTANIIMCSMEGVMACTVFASSLYGEDENPSPVPGWLVFCMHVLVLGGVVIRVTYFSYLVRLETPPAPEKTEASDMSDEE